MQAVKMFPPDIQAQRGVQYNVESHFDPSTLFTLFTPFTPLSRFERPLKKVYTSPHIHEIKMIQLLITYLLAVLLQSWK